MKKNNKLNRVAITILLSLLTVVSASAHINQDKPLYDVVMSYPVGTDFAYENVGIEEIERVGPAAIALTQSGNFIIADTPNSRLLIFTANGQKVQEITIPDAVGITDIATHEDEIYALDSAAMEPTIFHLNSLGYVLERIRVDPAIRDAGLTGFKIGENGHIFFEMEFGSRFLDENGASVNGEALSLASVATATETTGNLGQSANILVAGSPFTTISLRNSLAGVRPLALRPNGDIFIAVTELVSLPEIIVDQTIRQYDAKGRLIGVARVPVSESFAYAQNNIVISQEGGAYVLLPRENSVDVLKLSFHRKLASILPLVKNIKSDPNAEAGSLACSITRSQIASNAYAYINNSVNLSSTNISGTCSGRTKPHYLGSAGTYSSVPYDWGGNDSISGFNSYMTSGYKTGDINTAASESCSRGVDCSGFVGRTFGLSTKYSTSTLPNIAPTISQSSLIRGDILNKSGVHVVLFDSLGSNGVWAWEATVNANVDRVVRAFSSWTRLSGYTPRRYNGVCS